MLWESREGSQEHRQKWTAFKGLKWERMGCYWRARCAVWLEGIYSGSQEAEEVCRCCNKGLVNQGQELGVCPKPLQFSALETPGQSCNLESSSGCRVRHWLEAEVSTAIWP